MNYFNIHAHTDFSNTLLGFSDAITRVSDLIQYAYDLGLSGIAITEHEGISSHLKAIKYYNSMQLERPFKLGLGNEIYLMEEYEDRENKENHNTYPYYHFILLALDTEGHKQIRELSTRAWERAWKQGKIYRRATYYSDLEEIIQSNQGHIVGSSACLGGRINKLLLNNDIDEADKEVERLIKIFGQNNFYLEYQPAKEKDTEQWKANNLLKQTAEYHKIKIIPSTDVHYLKKDDAWIHKIFLQSQEGDREVDDFYATTYVMSPDELREYSKLNFNDEEIDQMFKWSNEIVERIQEYDLFHKPIIPRIPIEKLPKDCIVSHAFKEWYDKYPNFKYYATETLDEHEKYFFYQIEQGLIEKVVQENKDVETYIKRLDEEFEQFKLIGEALNTSIPCYFSSMSKIIDLIWEANSLAMPGRGSSVACLCNYLLDVTQVDPVPLGDYLPFFRFMNIARGAELPD